jgi:hypothetical protein
MTQIGMTTRTPTGDTGRLFGMRLAKSTSSGARRSHCLGEVEPRAGVSTPDGRVVKWLAPVERPPNVRFTPNCYRN